MACDDRQLSEAQRQAGFQQQRTGVMRAVRPFSGPPTLDNLIDYLNRELYPAVRSSREKVNDVHSRVMDNAPSANPLAYYFSAETASGDPTGGRIRLNASPQSGATTMRVSQVNGRAEDVLAWLEVMAGGATTPLGVVTLFDAINPARFVRFDLESMTDQGAYWDLVVTPIEGSHDDPFVEGEAVVLSFIAGVASDGVTVDPGAITPIGANTVLGNPTASTAAPTEIPVDDLSVLGRAGLAGTGNLEDITVPDAATFAGESVFLRSSSLRTALQFRNFTLVDLPSINDNRFVGNLTGATARPFYTDFGDLNSTTITYTSHSFVREELTGDITAPQNSNTTTFRSFSALSVLARAANSAGVPTELSAVAGSGAVLRESGSAIAFGTLATAGLADDAVTNAKLAEMAANTVKANATASTANPTDFAVGTNTVLGRVAANIVAAQLVNAQITDATIANAKLANMAVSTIKGRATGGGTGVPQDLTGAQVGQIVRFSSAESGPGTAGSYEPTLAETTTIYRPGPTAGVDVTFTGFSFTGGNSGKVFLLVNFGGTGRTILKNNSGVTATNGIYTPFDQDYVMGGPNSACILWYQTSANRWSVVGAKVTDANHGDITVTAGGETWTINNNVITNAKLVDMVAGTVKGRQIDASTGPPVDLTGLEVAELLRYGTTQAVTLAATTNDQTLNADTTVLRVTPTGAQTLTGLTGGSQGRLVFIENIAGSGNNLTLASLSASSLTANRFRTPQGLDVVIGFRETALLRWETNNNDWRLVARTMAGFALTDGDKGDITVSASGATWTIDSGAVTSGKIGGDAVDDTKLRNSGACSVIGRAANSSGDPADISAAANDRVLSRTSDTLAFTQVSTNMIADGSITVGKIAGIGANTVIANATAGTTNPTAFSVGTNSVLGRVAGNIVAAQVVTAQITDAAVTLGKLADLAQSRIIGRAEGAGTAAPTALTPTEVVAIIDGESPTWTGTHTFTGTNHTVTTTSNIGLTAGASITLAATTVVAIPSPSEISAANLNGTVRLTGVITPTVSSDQNNWNPSGIGSANVIRINCTSATTIHGIVAQSSGTVLMLVNVGSATVVIANESASATAANRIVHLFDAPNIVAGATWTLWYDGDSSRWRVQSIVGQINP